MRATLLHLLGCPDCRGDITSDNSSGEQEVFEDGDLRCSRCHRRYPIRNGIPRMLSSRGLSRQERRTREVFAYEWEFYRRWGWMSEVTPGGRLALWGSRRADAERAFWTKSLLTENDVAGRVVLDAGCGNGRYAFQAARLARVVVGLDISEAVDAAGENTRSCPNVEIVQGDVLRPPFRPNVFDTIFSIGVLGFTANAEGACQSLVRLLRDDGVIAVQFSHRGNAVFEMVDNAVRSLTSRLSVRNLMRFAAFMAGLGRLAHALRVARYVNLILRLQPTRHHMFDWYGARRIDRRCHEEVFEWFRRSGVDVVAHDRREDRPRWLRRIAFPWALAVKGRKRLPVGAAPA